MKSAPHLNSRDGARGVQLEGFGPTRNRKVVGSNPTSGSKTAGQRAFLALLTAQRQRAVIPLGWIIAPQAHCPASLRRCAARLPAGSGSDAERRNTGWNLGARPSREVDRGRHDLCGCAAIHISYTSTAVTHRRWLSLRQLLRCRFAPWYAYGRIPRHDRP